MPVIQPVSAANVIAPGQVLTPDVFPNPGSVSILDSVTGNFSFNSGALTGSYHELVFDDPFGITCVTCLDFAFLISVDPGSTGSISTFGFGNVSCYTTDVGYIPGIGGGTDPNFIERLPAPGLAVGWGFDLGVGPGQSTDLLLVATNATSFDTSGLVSFNQDSAGLPGGFLFDFAGSVAAPEPAAALLPSLGMLGIAAFRKKAN
jgi:hypothetical protein